MHGALRPDNVMLDSRMSIRLADYGRSREVMHASPPLLRMGTHGSLACARRALLARVCLERAHRAVLAVQRGALLHRQGAHRAFSTKSPRNLRRRAAWIWRAAAGFGLAAVAVGVASRANLGPL